MSAACYCNAPPQYIRQRILTPGSVKWVFGLSQAFELLEPERPPAAAYGSPVDHMQQGLQLQGQLMQGQVQTASPGYGTPGSLAPQWQPHLSPFSEGYIGG